jgi:hypothetical protein
MISIHSDSYDYKYFNVYIRTIHVSHRARLIFSFSVIQEIIIPTVILIHTR